MSTRVMHSVTIIAALTLLYGVPCGAQNVPSTGTTGEEPLAVLGAPGLRGSRAAGSALRTDRPAWVVDDVPDTVWILAEAAAAADDGEEAREILLRAEGLARQALVGHEGSVGRRFALAVVLGMRTEREGGRTKLDVAGELYETLDAVLALDPEHSRARHLMGRLHVGVRQMTGVTRWLAKTLFGGELLGEASWEQAERHLAFAEEHAPEVPDHHLQLALLYLETERPGRAAAEARHVLELEASSPMERMARGEAARILGELTGG